MGTDWSNAVPIEFHLVVQDVRPLLITTRAIVVTPTSSTKLSKDLCSFNCPNIAIPVLSSCGLIQLEFNDPDFHFTDPWGLCSTWRSTPERTLHMLSVCCVALTISPHLGHHVDVLYVYCIMSDVLWTKVSSTLVTS
jgi:hypothetical protein